MDCIFFFKKNIYKIYVTFKKEKKEIKQNKINMNSKYFNNNSIKIMLLIF